MTNEFDQSSPSVMPSFMVEHDGSQLEMPREENETAGQKFDTFVDDSFLNFPLDTNRDAILAMDTLLLTLPKTDGYWAISIKKHAGAPFTSDPSWDPRTEVELQDMSGSKLVAAYYYRKYADGVLRRFTKLSTTIETELETEACLMPYEETKQQELQRLGREAINMTNNVMFTRQIGMNDQPVGTSEIDGLIALLSSPEVIVRA